MVNLMTRTYAAEGRAWEPVQQLFSPYVAKVTDSQVNKWYLLDRNN